MNRFLILVRHGSAGGDNGQRYLGHTDLPIGALGESQSLALKQWLEPWSIEAAYCSDLARCRSTAEIAVGGRNIALKARRDLRECRMGLWEGRLKSDIARDFPEEDRARQRDLINHRAPGGENFQDCAGRVVRAMEEILADCAGNILLVGHGSTNRLLLCHLLGLPIANMFRLGQDHGCVNIVRMDQAECRVMLLNGRP